MTTPITHLLFDRRGADTHEGRYLREIDNHYQLQMTAKHHEDLVQYQVEFNRIQAAAAAERLREAQQSKEAITEGFARVCAMSERIEAALVNGFEATNEAIDEQTEVIEHGFAVVAERLLTQQKVLTEIAKVLRRPLKTRMLELLDEANKWLLIGLNQPGQDSEENFADALRLLLEVIKNPIGNQDYVTWFQIGLLQWKHTKSLPDAEQSFRRAARLSAPEQNAYWVLSSRHLGCIHYLQGRMEDAYGAIEPVLSVADPETLFDAARYAARSGRKDIALKLLDKCIDHLPSAFLRMFAERDFS